MDDNSLVKSSFSATINAPIEKVDIPSWCSLMVQHYIEVIGQPDRLRLVFNSDVLTPAGRTKINVVWDLSVKKISDNSCEFTNTIHTSATPELTGLLGKQGIPWEVFEAARVPVSEAHDRQETPRFAENIQRHALARK